ncbi:hypothetical protein NN561_017240 [Cricetulus griseus]
MFHQLRPYSACTSLGRAGVGWDPGRRGHNRMHGLETMAEEEARQLLADERALGSSRAVRNCELGQLSPPSQEAPREREEGGKAALPPTVLSTGVPPVWRPTAADSWPPLFLRSVLMSPSRSVCRQPAQRLCL